MGITVWALVLLSWPYHSDLRPVADKIKVYSNHAECAADISKWMPNGREYLFCSPILTIESEERR